MGHALHDIDPVFDAFSRMPKNALLLKDLGVDDPLLLQSMYICKQPHIGGEVTCHQDSTFLYTTKNSVVGLWFALEDATLENGCMWAIPGGHRSPLRWRSLRDNTDNIKKVVLDETPWDESKMIPLEVPQGSLVVLHGLLPHKSDENRSARSRHAYSVHVVPSQDEYPQDNWLRRTADMPLRGFD